uniref:Diacylglycerol O-acyltransferase n=1 Tax=Kalanchoe fedtschenkoi TaxID=63787 RepID=A0A7N0VK60_KALFE
MGHLVGGLMRKPGLTLPTIKTGNNRVVNEEGQPLSPMSRLFHKPDSNVYIIAILAPKCLIDPQHVKANMGDMVHAHPRFSCLQVVDEEKGGSAGMKWVKTEVNFEDHVVVPKIDPTTIGCHKKYLEDYMYNLSKTTVDMSKPLWDVHILNGLNTSEASKAVVIIRIHHSMGDGMSLMSVLLTFSRKATDENAMPDMLAPAKKSSTTTKPLTGRVISFFRIAWNTFVDVLMFFATLLYLSDVKTPLKGPPDVGYNPKRMVLRTFQLHDVKMVSRATKTTVNDVLMGMMESALSRYLSRKQVISSGGGGQERDRPESIKLKAVVFFNIRLLSGVHPIKEMVEEGSLAKWGNKIGYALYPFDAMMRCNPLEYVFRAKAVMDRKKASLESQFTYFFCSILLKIIGVKALGFPTSPTFFFSSLMGPREEISLFGYPIDYVASTCYGAPTALLVHVTSYADKLTFALSVDEDTIPHPHLLCEDLDETLTLFKQALHATPPQNTSETH